MNKTNIKNPNHDSYWKEKGYSKRPEDWKELLAKKSKRQKNKERYDSYSGCGPDGLGSFDSMFTPLCKDDY